MTKNLERPVDVSRRLLPTLTPRALTLVLVISQNWMITSGNTDVTVQEWVSLEDRAYFAYLRSLATLSILGSKTFQEIATFIPPSGGPKLIVMTRQPEILKEKYPDLKQALFTSESPEEISARVRDHFKLRTSGIGLHLGGAESALAFLNSPTPPDELLLTIEPITFVNGLEFPAEALVEQYYELIEEYQLNAGGTRLLHFRVRRRNT